MKLKHTALWSGVVAAALLLTACGKSNSGSGSMSSSGMSSSTASTATINLYRILRNRFIEPTCVFFYYSKQTGICVSYLKES